jgi:hypothetical protein
MAAIASNRSYCNDGLVFKDGRCYTHPDKFTHVYHDQTCDEILTQGEGDVILLNTFAKIVKAAGNIVLDVNSNAEQLESFRSIFLLREVSDSIKIPKVSAKGNVHHIFRSKEVIKEMTYSHLYRPIGFLTLLPTIETLFVTEESVVNVVEFSCPNQGTVFVDSTSRVKKVINGIAVEEVN